MPFSFIQGSSANFFFHKITTVSKLHLIKCHSPVLLVTRQVEYIKCYTVMKVVYNSTVSMMDYVSIT